ncbi:sugar MFS transporter [Sphingobacterium paucimobilis]|uniref:Major facilitator transporter n=1 Tax=Sphingobacterium paucimobilis HER1398 TaxID=1346330 RepID=U2HBI5_9SPHI|nr:sugar MFS transporter [Sphingobacterium paucimobilis]ERJ59091.1 major facilitator transporter [Sphingobacterium paucimobilis HER1398]
MTTQTLDKKSTYISIGIIGMMFFIFGFVSWVNAILIPYFKIACELTNFQSYLVAFAFYISYLVMSMPSSYLLKRVGYKKGIVVGFWIMALGALLFVPAAFGRTYLIFLLGLFTLGAGLAVLQTVANLYITLIGDKERAAQRISIMGICNKGAGILAPLVFSWAILRPSDNELFKAIPLMDDILRASVLDDLIMRVVVPYSVMAAVLFLIGLFVRFSPLPEIENPEGAEASAGRDSLFQFPHLVLGAIAIFLHVGTQVIAIDTIISYADSMGVTLLEAKSFPSYTLSATIVGYFLGILLIPRVLSQKRMLQICSLLGLFFAVMVCVMNQNVGWMGYDVNVSIWFLVFIGLPNALIWAGIWPLALDGLGKYAKQGSALLIMGLCGNAILPMIYGAVADKVNEQLAYWVLVPCFLYIAFYAFYGHKVTSWKKV